MAMPVAEVAMSVAVPKREEEPAVMGSHRRAVIVMAFDW